MKELSQWPARLHPLTAQAIADQIGLDGGRRPLTGAGLGTPTILAFR